MKRIIIGAAICLSLAACGPTQQFVKASATESVVKYDARECVYEAKKSVIIPYGGSTVAVINAAMAQEDLFRSCMMVKGYHLEDIR
jgi:hypothetical protein